MYINKFSVIVLFFVNGLGSMEYFNQEVSLKLQIQVNESKVNVLPCLFTLSKIGTQLTLSVV